MTENVYSLQSAHEEEPPVVSVPMALAWNAENVLPDVGALMLVDVGCEHRGLSRV